MVYRKGEKYAGLILAVIIILLSLCYAPDWSISGLRRGSAIQDRLSYSFLHASFLHAAINSWCFLSIIFRYDIKWWHLAIAYIIALAVPNCILFTIPTVGLSALCFALLGMIMFKVKRKSYYNICLSIYIAAGFIAPGVNGWIHLYSYMAGLLVGCLDAPISCPTR